MPELKVESRVLVDVAMAVLVVSMVGAMRGIVVYMRGGVRLKPVKSVIVDLRATRDCFCTRWRL